MKTLIYNIDIITQNKQREQFVLGYIVINNNYIQSVESGEYVGDKNEIDIYINGAGLFVTPGLINVHVHLGETIYEKFLPERFNLEQYLSITDDLVTKYDIIESNRKIIGEYTTLKILKGGVSTVAGGRVREIAENLSIRNVSGLMIMNSRKLKKNSVDIYKKYKKEMSLSKWSGLSKIAVFIHSLGYIEESDLAEVKMIIDQYPETMIMIHVCETLKQETIVVDKFGGSSIQVLKKKGLLNKNTLLVHANWLTDEDLIMISKAGSSIVHCLSSNIKIADNVLDIHRAMKFGINICLATDGVCTSSTYSVLDEAKNVYLRNHGSPEKSMSAQQVFDMITLTAARAIGMENIIGSIEKGKRADLAFWQKPKKLFNCDNLVNYLMLSGGPAELQHLIIDGKKVIWYKNMSTVSENKIISNYRTLTSTLKKLEDESNIS